VWFYVRDRDSDVLQRTWFNGSGSTDVLSRVWL
jgi:hypothetical protein